MAGMAEWKTFILAEYEIENILSAKCVYSYPAGRNGKLSF